MRQALPMPSQPSATAKWLAGSAKGGIASAGELPVTGSAVASGRAAAGGDIG
jgi:hypothetical protein